MKRGTKIALRTAEVLGVSTLITFSEVIGMLAFGLIVFCFVYDPKFRGIF